MDIYFDNKAVGLATHFTEGLYTRLQCTCKLPDKKLYVLYLRNHSEERLLGTLIPHGRSWVLETKIPKKLFEQGNVVIYAAAKYTESEGEAEELKPGEPVRSVCCLEQMRYLANGGKYCLAFQKTAQEKASRLCEVNSINS